MINKDKYLADVIIISYKRPDLTIQCVKSIRETSPNNIRIIIVDNASPDDTVQVLKQNLYDVEIVQNDENYGYAKAVNIGISKSESSYIVISNNDVIYHSNLVDGLLLILNNNPDIGAVGPSQQYLNGAWQISNGLLPGLALGLRKMFLFEFVSNTARKVFWKSMKGKGIVKNAGYIDGACIAMKRSAFDAVGGFDEDYFFYTEEADFCFKLQKAGWKTVTNQKYVITHIRGGTKINSHLSTENINALVNSKKIFCRKHLSDFETRMYISLEKIYSLNYACTMKMIKFITTKQKKEIFNDKIRVMNDYYNAWKSEEKVNS